MASQTPLCYVTSKADGSFVFPSVPSGTYYLVPFYKGEHITFDVEPERLDFEVSHDSFLIEVMSTSEFDSSAFCVKVCVCASDLLIFYFHMIYLLSFCLQAIGTNMISNSRIGYGLESYKI